jgi:hypothetical protein
MDTLVMGSALTYTAEKAMPFVVSLRKHYNGKVLLLVSETIDPSFFKLLVDYGIDFIHQPTEDGFPNSIMYRRFALYQQYIDWPIFDTSQRFFLTDVRDVVFQRSPFSLPLTCDLEFYCEQELIKNCYVNNGWISERYGLGEARAIGDNHVVCAGTISCTRKGLIDVCDKITQATVPFLERGMWPNDQAILNHLIYTNQLFNYRLVVTGDGTVSTMHYEKLMMFNQNGELCNKDGSVAPVVHQWDRTGSMASIFRAGAETAL